LRVLIDTSAWVDFLNGTSSTHADAVEALLRGDDEVYRRLRERGVTIRSTIDCIIAVIAEEAGCALLARDRDLDALLASGLVKVEPWPAATP
jgi:predicted nucleic acid-binding protein